MANIQNYVVRDVVGLDANAPCREAAELMAKRHIGAVAVRQDGRTIGLITERDLVTRILSRGLECSTPIVEAMRRDVPTIASEANEVECASLMKEHETRHLLVGDRQNIIGLISMRDVMQMMLSDKQYLIEQMQAYIQGY
jgi:signal-transduction protein with cAMP-binding, CBS, and nucleotidyltransferase domain